MTGDIRYYISVRDVCRTYETANQRETLMSHDIPDRPWTKANIRLKEDAEPHVDRPRKCNINLKPKIEAELKQMEDTGIIRKVREHTDWCSSIVYSTKSDGSLRICIDPRRLNESIKRCPHKMPTLEEINPAFVGAKHFSKLDAKAGYWSVQLEEQSQLLTTFRTPIGRYCYQRLPFGLCLSQDIFQQRMDGILESLEGCVGIAEDICIFGATQEEHDQRLIALMEVANSAVFNATKCSINQSSISFFGNVYSAAGIGPDPTKVKDINEMPVPQYRDDLQRFFGMVTYMGGFIPNLRRLSSILRDLLRKDVPFEWSEDHQMAFNTLKGAITTDARMTYYDVTKPITLEVDASQKGLGAALVQEKKQLHSRQKPSQRHSQTTATYNERCCLSSTEWRGSTRTYTGGPSQS